jgi:GAF domain-containing protein
MKRRSRAGGKASKARRSRTVGRKRPNAPNEVARRVSSAAGANGEVVRLTRELNDALEQQTATSEVLQIISSSAGDLEPVFATMLGNAARICDAKFGNIFSWDGKAMRLVGTHNTPPAFAEYRKRRPLPLKPNLPFSRMVAAKAVVHCTDAAALPAYTEQHDRDVVAAVELGGIRTFVAVPMLKGNKLIGALIVYRQDVRPFTEKQIESVKNFAAQAVIAIENARLLHELRQSTADLTEALEQQTATANVLEIISRSAFDLRAVFETLVESSVKLCGADRAFIFRFDGELLRTAAFYNASPEFAEWVREHPIRPGTHSGAARAALERRTIHIPDVQADPEFTYGAKDFEAVRTVLAVPILKGDDLLGVMIMNRLEVRPFSDQQIALVETFADQATIAIENVRLLDALRQRTTDLTEALEQQTATSEVLQVISSSPGDLEPVFATMLEKAVRVCDAKFGNIYRWDGDALHLVATRNTPPAFAEARRYSPSKRPGPKTVTGRMLAAKSVVHVADATAEPGYGDKSDPDAVAAVELAGVRTILAVPMWKEDELIGSFTVYRQEVRSFTDKQIALVTNFAAQAVIAIENARLLNELRERTGQLEVQSQEVVKLNQQLEQRVADQVGEIERMGRLRRFLPPQVADLIVASEAERQLESHRREITALFCDLRGFTGFSESSDPEDVMALLRDYHAAIGEIIIKYSGTLERYAGDGVMVVFNDPVPVDNPALQAVLMALEIRDAIGALTEKWRRLGHDIGFGIGIAHGFATLGTIGFEGRFDYAAIGTVSNVASRLCDEAKPGQILISPRVLMAVEDGVTVEPVGEFELKGIRRPIAAYNVLSAGSPKA